MKIRNNSGSLRLLEHHFRNVDGIGVKGLSSGKYSSIFLISIKNIVLNSFYFDIGHRKN